MQALILAGGEGTRLRPITSTMPKPVVPLAGRPFISYMLEWLRGHGVDDVILSCGFMAAGVREVLGDGSGLGIGIRYLEEPAPLGTGGAVKFAQDLLEERFLVLNGDVLTDIDLTAQLRQHGRTDARATLALIPVEDPSAYGLVSPAQNGAVKEFLEKPGPEQTGPNLINAGAYVLERDVLDAMAPSGTNISIEREVFPELVDRGLFGFVANGYWLDIGTPQRYLQATYDILEGIVSTEVGQLLRDGGLAVVDGATVRGRVVGPALVAPGAVVAEGAVVGGKTVIGRDVTIADGAHVEGSVVMDGSRVGAGTTLSGSIVGPAVAIGERCHIDGGVVLGERVALGPGNALASGMRIFPGVELPEEAIRF